MRIEHKVTLQCMKQNKRRTFVTILGVILCVAMITGVSIIGLSVQKAMITAVEKTQGSYEIGFRLPLSSAKEVRKDDRVKDMLIGQLEQDQLIDPSIQKNEKKQISLMSGNVEHLDLMGISLVEGKLPISSNEILVSKGFLKQKEKAYKIGDKVTFNEAINILDKKTSQYKLTETGKHITYTISGIVNADFQELQNNGFFRAFKAFDEQSTVEQDVMVYLNVNKGQDLNAFRKDMMDTYQVHADGIELNNQLLMYQGNSNSTISNMVKLATTIVGILILIGGVSLIYNAFAISLSERSRYLGMLSSVGATRKQKRNSILFEAIVIGVISIPAGILAGYLGMFITFYFINPLFKSVMGEQYVLEMVIEPSYILIVIIFSLLLLFISAWIPAKKASRISPVMAIRQSDDVKIRRQDVKTNSIVSRIFGFEATIALKNLKRNRSRYIATQFSLIVCVVLYLSTSTFSTLLRSSYEDIGNLQNADLIMNIQYRDQDGNETGRIISETEITKLRNLKYASGVNVSSEGFMVIPVKADQVSKKTEKVLDTYLKEQSYPELESDKFLYLSNNTRVLGMPQIDFEKYCKEAGIDARQFDEGTSAIFINTTKIKLADGFQNVTWIDMKHKDTLNVQFSEQINQEDVEKNKEGYLQKTTKYALDIQQTTDVLPSFVERYTYFPVMYVVMNQKSLERLSNKLSKDALNTDTINSNLKLYFTSDYTNELEKEISVNYKGENSHSYAIMNIAANKLRSDQMNLILEIFLYGFVVLILLVCTTNIVNTMSTSIQLRKREFAMIKSVGITPRKFTKMTAFESIFYGMKALLYGLPISFMIMWLLSIVFGTAFGNGIVVPWISVWITIIGIFLLVMMTMMYSIHKIRKDNIVETIRQESI